MSDLRDSTFLKACRREPVPSTPVWFMRQAGRALPEYREKRGSESILEAIRNPELAAELTLQPVHRYGVDAAILFSDIVVPVAAIGFGVDIAPGIGPVVEQPFAGPSDLPRLRALEPEADVPWVQETVRILTRELQVPLIGFAGAPFTIASYLIEGRASRTYEKTKALMHGDPATFRKLMDAIARISLASLRAQVEAGASAVQLFDSWAGALSPSDYAQHVAGPTGQIFAGLEDLGVPRIHFGVDTGELLDQMAGAGADVVGIDWRVPLDRARARVGPERAVQGNLDPVICLSSWDVVRPEAQRILGEAGGRPGHIFNLGHGVLPDTDPDVLARLVDFVHDYPLAG